MSKNEAFIKELNELKRKEEKEIQTIKDLRFDINSLKSKLDVLSDVKVSIDPTAQKTIDILVSDVARLSALIRPLNIPKEIKVIKKHEVSFSDKTKLVLLVFFFTSLIVCGGSVWYANWRIEEIENQPQEVIYSSDDSEIYKWLMNYYTHFEDIHPNDTENYIRENPISE